MEAHMGNPSTWETVAGGSTTSCTAYHKEDKVGRVGRRGEKEKGQQLPVRTQDGLRDQSLLDTSEPSLPG